MRRAFLLIGLALLGCALLASHQRKPFPLLIDQAEAMTIVCNPVLVPSAPERRKVVRA